MVRLLGGALAGLVVGVLVWHLTKTWASWVAALVSVGSGSYAGLIVAFFAPDALARLTRFDTRGFSVELGTRGESAAAEERVALEAVRDEIRKIVDSQSSLASGAVETAAESALAATGRLAEVELSQAYDQIASRAESHAARFQFLGAAALIAAFGLAFWLVHGLHDPRPSAPEILARLSISLPGAALFAYLTSEASIYRQLSTWSTQVAVQLRSVSAYVDRLDPDARKIILRELGLKVFVGSEHNVGSRRRGKRDVDLLEVISKVVDLTRKPLP